MNFWNLGVCHYCADGIVAISGKRDSVSNFFSALFGDLCRGYALFNSIDFLKIPPFLLNGAGFSIKQKGKMRRENLN